MGSPSKLRVHDPGSADTQRHQDAGFDGVNRVIVQHRECDTGGDLGLVADDRHGAGSRGRAEAGRVESDEVEVLHHTGAHRGSRVVRDDLLRDVRVILDFHNNRRIGRMGDRGRGRRHVHGDSEQQECAETLHPFSFPEV